MIAWPSYNRKLLGTVLIASNWDVASGIIADQTRSGKLKTRASHIHTPDSFNITMHMTLPEYRIFDNWWKNVCRKGVYTFAYPKINDNTGVFVEYQFAPDTGIGIKNTSADNLEISMSWMEAT
jgi:hypothetical protein